jgi:signal transduction histidine kinase
MSATADSLRTTRRIDVAQRLSHRYWKLLTLAMLVLLHVAAMLGIDDIWARAVLIAHFGIFMVWQPFLQGDQRLHAGEVLAVVIAAIVILFALNWWLLGLWVAVLAGLVGGKVFIFQRKGIRAFYLLMLAYLVALLLLWVVPNGFPNSNLEPAVQALARYGLATLFLVMFLIRLETDTAEPQIVDLFYATLIFLLLVVLVLGGFAFMTLGRVSYGLALTYTLLTLACVLLFLAAVWNPRAGFAGLSVFFSRYLLSIGLPFEQWLHFLAELSRSETKPDQFLGKACAGLGQLQWVTGGEWQAGGESGSFGTQSPHAVEFKAPELSIRIYSRVRASPSLVWHLNVLGRLLAQVYVAKQRELKLKQQSYVQAVHETGAKLTHDVKNLLQSLNVLCSAAEQDRGDPQQLQAMIRRHLPVVTQRLQATLDKLQRPTVETGRFIRPEVWWEAIKRAYVHPAVEFEAEITNAAIGPVPRDLFETAADNLINNALEKRKLDPNVRVTVRLRCTDQITFSIADTGKPVPREVVRGLFQGPVASETGYGIGLFQLFRQAEASGYKLRLIANESGNVCFELASV